MRLSKLRASGQPNSQMSEMERSLTERASTHDELAQLAAKVAGLEAIFASPAAPPLAPPLAPTPPPPPPEPEPLAEPKKVAPPAPTEWEPLWRLKEGREILLQGFHWDSCKHDW